MDVPSVKWYSHLQADATRMMHCRCEALGALPERCRYPRHWALQSRDTVGSFDEGITGDAIGTFLQRGESIIDVTKSSKLPCGRLVIIPVVCMLVSNMIVFISAPFVKCKYQSERRPG
jgi:hypothetical protein